MKITDKLRWFILDLLGWGDGLSPAELRGYNFAQLGIAERIKRMQAIETKYNRQQLVLREIQADIEQLRDEWNNSQITEWSKGILLSIQRELEDNLK